MRSVLGGGLAGSGGRYVELPGRGRAFVHERSGPEGAPTLLLLHGWAATAGHNWRALLDLLGEQHHVIAPDMPGHGRGPAISESFGLCDSADHAAAVCEALGVGHVTVVGYSMGGAVAQLMWERNREYVDGLVLCATAMQLSGTLVERGIFRTIDALEPMSRFLPDRLRRKIEDRLVEQLGDESELISGSEEHEHSLRALLRVGKSIGRFDSRTWAQNIDVPTAIVATTLDSKVPVGRQLALARAISGATVYTVVGEHGAILDDPQCIAPRISTAVADVCQRSIAARSALVELSAMVAEPVTEPLRPSRRTRPTSVLPWSIELVARRTNDELDTPVLHRTLELPGPDNMPALA